MRITKDGKITTHRDFDSLVMLLLSKLQKGLCATCPAELVAGGFQIAHKRYGLDITLKDIELKCGSCHAVEHGFKAQSGTLRHSLSY